MVLKQSGAIAMLALLGAGVAACGSEPQVVAGEEVEDEVLTAGESTWQANCAACHGTGAGGAPVAGRERDWEPRVGKGLGELVANAVNGYNNMPARGGNDALSDDEVRSAVAYMVSQIE